MKRAPEEDDSLISHQTTLPPELWNFIASQPYINFPTLASLFLLNKEIHFYMMKFSIRVRKRCLISEINRLFLPTSEDKSDTECYRCAGECRKILLLNAEKIPELYGYRGFICARCRRKCKGCSKFYTRPDRAFHRDCKDFPVPFSPHASDDDYDDVTIYEEEWEDVYIVPDEERSAEEHK